MLKSVIASAPAGERILVWIGWASLIIELIAVVIIVLVIFSALSHYLVRAIFSPEQGDHYQQLKIRLGKGLLLGLEILVAADEDFYFIQELRYDLIRSSLSRTFGAISSPGRLSVTVEGGSRGNG